MNLKKMIVLSLTLLFVFSFLAMAEEFVGESISWADETPHPYGRMNGESLVWSTTIEHLGAQWIKPHFTDFRLNDGDYVILKDAKGNEIDRIEGNEIRKMEHSRFRVIAPSIDQNLSAGQGNINSLKVGQRDPRVSFWGPAIDGEFITVELHRTIDRRRGWGFKIDEVAVGVEPIRAVDEPELSGVESICGGDDKTCPKDAGSTYYTLGESVGRMLFQKGTSWYVCTGFLVSSAGGYFLTNEHCITDQTGVNSLEVLFNYRYTNTGCSTAGTYATYYGNQFVKDSPNGNYCTTTLDYCLLTLSGNPQNTYGYLQLDNRKPSTGEDIFIIQHPSGRRQEISFGSADAFNCRDMGYMADTEGGSSGSPVLSETNDKVVGLHHYGGCYNAGVMMDIIYENIIGYLSGQ